jgi:LmbE family N-acetylglucosaminyl deacetylase
LKLLISPHNDDGPLFAAFTLIREKPLMLTVLDSYIQPARGHVGCDAETRRAEDFAACAILNAAVTFLGFRDDRPDWRGVEAAFRTMEVPEMVWAPAIEDGGHEHHNRIGELAAKVFPRVTFYATYTKAGKSTGTPVPYEPAWIGKKLRALSCYESQIALKCCSPHFIREQSEYAKP